MSIRYHTHKSAKSMDCTLYSIYTLYFSTTSSVSVTYSLIYITIIRGRTPNTCCVLSGFTITCSLLSIESFILSKKSTWIWLKVNSIKKHYNRIRSASFNSKSYLNLRVRFQDDIFMLCVCVCVREWTTFVSVVLYPLHLEHDRWDRRMLCAFVRCVQTHSVSNVRVCTALVQNINIDVW